MSSFHYTETVDNPLNKSLWKNLTDMFGRKTVPDLDGLAFCMALFVTRESDECAGLRPVTARDEQAMIEAERWFERLLHTASNQTR